MSNVTTLGNDLPVAVSTVTDESESSLPFGLQVLTNPTLFDNTERYAKMCAGSSTTPAHLRGNVPACFDVICLSMNFKLNPQAVMRCTFDPGGGKLGYEGKLVQAIMEASGRLEDSIEKEWFGDWDRVLNKFEMIETEKEYNGKKKKSKYARASYKAADEDGLGITVSTQVKGRGKRESFTLFLKQCQPRNSTLWATDPKTQIYYTAVRRLASVACPSVLMGMPFDDDAYEQDHVGPENAIDVTESKEEAAETVEDALDAFAGKEPSTTTIDAKAETIKPAQPAEERKPEEPKAPKGVTVWIAPLIQEPADTVGKACQLLDDKMREAKDANEASIMLAQNTDWIPDKAMSQLEAIVDNWGR